MRLETILIACQSSSMVRGVGIACNPRLIFLSSISNPAMPQAYHHSEGGR